MPKLGLGGGGEGCQYYVHVYGGLHYVTVTIIMIVAKQGNNQ